MKVIAIANQKGGVAKTTSTHNIGVALAKQGKKTLLIDLDPQANLTICLGIEPLEVENTVVQALQHKNPTPLKDCIVNISDNLDAVTSIVDLSGIEMEMIMRAGREKILDRALNKVKDDYDFVLIDCPPQLSILTINALSCADEVIIPVKTDYLSYRGLTQLYSTVAEVQEIINPKLHVFGIIATFFESSVNDDKDVLAMLEKNYNVIGVTKKKVDTRKGIYDGKSVVEKFPHSEVAITYQAVAEMLAKG